MKSLVAPWALLAVAAFAGAGRAGWTSPARADGWEEAVAPPEWVLAPPVREGFVRIVDGAQSDQLELAYGFRPGSEAVVERAVRDGIAARLRPVIGKDADKAAKVPLQKAVLVKKAFHLDPGPPEHRDWPGSQTYTAWVLWEVPSDGVLAAVPEDRRAEARKALEHQDLAAGPAWEAVEKAPTWSEKPEAAVGRVAIATTEDADRADVAKANAAVLAASRLGSAVTERLRALLGGEGASTVGRLAATSGVARSRAVRLARGQATTWTLWDLPLDVLLEAVPVGNREAARPLLLADPHR